MRIRSIKPEFWRSADVANLSREYRLLFVGLWSYVDDNGVGVDDYRQIAADLFALEDDPKEARDYVREGLATLSRHLMVVRYSAGGRELIYVPTWDKHQRVDRPNKERYPRPPADWKPPTSEDVRPDAHLKDVSRDSRENDAAGAVEQGSSGEQISLPTAAAASVPVPEPERTPDEWFVDFWAAYPRRADRQDALRAFKAVLKKRLATPERLIQAAHSYAQQNAGTETGYLKYGATWLNKGSYENEPEQTRFTVVPALPIGDPDEHIAHLRETANGRAAAELIGRPYLPKAQPPSDRTPAAEWDRREGLRFLAEHETEIREALAEREAG